MTAVQQQKWQKKRGSKMRHGSRTCGRTAMAGMMDGNRHHGIGMLTGIGRGVLIGDGQIGAMVTIVEDTLDGMVQGTVEILDGKVRKQAMRIAMMRMVANKVQAQRDVFPRHQPLWGLRHWRVQVEGTGIILHKGDYGAIAWKMQ